jgi:hypothetical protein
MDLLNDPYIFNSNGELSQKEIIKRFQDRGVQRPYNEVNEVYNRQDNSTRPPPRRVDTDPSVWQQESSVRPMQEPPIPYGNPGPGTPPQKWRSHEDGHHSPYNQQFDRSDPQLDNPDNGQRREWRNSGWGAQGRPNGGVGITGNM